MRKIQNGLVEIPLTAKCLLLFLTSVCLLCWGSYQYGKHAAAGNDNYSEGIQQAGEQLERAERDQHNVTAGIGSAEGTVNKSIAKIGDIEEKLCGAGEIIADCQRILAEVETRTVTR